MIHKSTGSNQDCRRGYAQGSTFLAASIFKGTEFTIGLAFGTTQHEALRTHDYFSFLSCFCKLVFRSDTTGPGISGGWSTINRGDGSTLLLRVTRRSPLFVKTRNKIALTKVHHRTKSRPAEEGSLQAASAEPASSIGADGDFAITRPLPAHVLRKLVGLHLPDPCASSTSRAARPDRP